MNPELLRVAAEWALAHPIEYATLALFSLAAAKAAIALLTEEKMPDTLGLEQPYGPPKKIDWVHPGQVVVDAANDRWEVTFVGPDFVTVGKVKNISYEIRKWRVIP